MSKETNFMCAKCGKTKPCSEVRRGRVGKAYSFICKECLIAELQDILNQIEAMLDMVIKLLKVLLNEK